MAWTMIFLLIGIYMAPTIVAEARKKSDTAAIAALNIFLGWSVLGWVIALVWALKKDK